MTTTIDLAEQSLVWVSHNDQLFLVNNSREDGSIGIDCRVLLVCESGNAPPLSLQSLIVAAPKLLKAAVKLLDEAKREGFRIEESAFGGLLQAAVNAAVAGDET